MLRGGEAPGANVCALSIVLRKTSVKGTVGMDELPCGCERAAGWDRSLPVCTVRSFPVCSVG